MDELYEQLKPNGVRKYTTRHERKDNAATPRPLTFPDPEIGEKQLKTAVGGGGWHGDHVLETDKKTGKRGGQRQIPPNPPNV